VRLGNILRRLRQVTAQYLQIGVPHRLLQAEHIHSCSQHVDGEGTPEGV
jgi:hypothetical protein